MKNSKEKKNGTDVLHQQYVIPCVLVVGGGGGDEGYQMTCHPESERDGFLWNAKSFLVTVGA